MPSDYPHVATVCRSGVMNVAFGTSPGHRGEPPFAGPVSRSPAYLLAGRELLRRHPADCLAAARQHSPLDSFAWLGTEGLDPARGRGVALIASPHEIPPGHVTGLDNRECVDDQETQKQPLSEAVVNAATRYLSEDLV